MSKFGSTQAAVYRFICGFYENNGITPTIREICAALGLKSTSNVHAHLKNLAQKGLIAQSPNKQRSITITAPDHARADGARRVPLVGRVAAGVPVLAEQNIQDYFTLSPALLRGGGAGEVFMLTVAGESMIEAGIHDGDAILIHKGLSVENGDIIVALVRREEATVKRFYLNANGTVRLQPENRTMEPIIVDRADVEIIGKLIGLYRKY